MIELIGCGITQLSDQQRTLTLTMMPEKTSSGPKTKTVEDGEIGSIRSWSSLLFLATISLRRVCSENVYTYEMPYRELSFSSLLYISY